MQYAYNVAMASRLAQLLGVTALAGMDRLRAAVGGDLGAGEPEAATLVHLQAWPGGSVNDLAQVVGRSQAATVRLVDRLVARGLLRREPGPDGRTVALRTTAAGRRAADGILARRAAGLETLVAGLDAAERVTLERLLERLTAGLADDRPGALNACRLCDRGACAEGAGCPLNHTVETSAPT